MQFLLCFISLLLLSGSFSYILNNILYVIVHIYGIQLSSSKNIGGILFADDFVGVSDSKENLQRLIYVVYSYCSKWSLRAIVSKNAVIVFSKDVVNVCWKRGEYGLAIVSYIY